MTDKAVALMLSSLRCMQLFAGILGRAGEQGTKTRLEAAKQGIVTYPQTHTLEGFPEGIPEKEEGAETGENGQVGEKSTSVRSEAGAGDGEEDMIDDEEDDDEEVLDAEMMEYDDPEGDKEDLEKANEDDDDDNDDDDEDDLDELDEDGDDESDTDETDTDDQDEAPLLYTGPKYGWWGRPMVGLLEIDLEPGMAGPEGASKPGSSGLSEAEVEDLRLDLHIAIKRRQMQEPLTDKDRRVLEWYTAVRDEQIRVKREESLRELEEWREQNPADEQLSEEEKRESGQEKDQERREGPEDK